MDTRFRSGQCIFSSDDMFTGNASTLILSIHSQYSDHVLNALSSSLRDMDYTTTDSLRGGTVLRTNVSRNGRTEGVIDSHYVCLVANVSDMLHRDIMKAMEDDFGYFKRVIFNVPHGYRRGRAAGGGRVMITTGILDKIDEMIPLSSFVMLDDGIVTAKALVKYYNSDIDEYEPTVAIIEAAHNRQDAAGVLLRYVEDELGQYGFARILAADPQNECFWTDGGYAIEGMHAVKRLS